MDIDRVNRFKEVFTGTKDQNIEAFLERFETWCAKNGHDNNYKTRYFSFLLDGNAFTCWKSLPREVKNDFQQIKQRFLAYYAPTELPIDEQYEQLIEIKLKKGEMVQHY